MLILSRKPYERLIINDEIRIMLLEIDLMRKEIKLGIEAPDNTSIWREEIYWKMQQDKLKKAYQQIALPKPYVPAENFTERWIEPEENEDE